MDPVTFIASMVAIVGFIYLLLIGQKSLPEWWQERRKKTNRLDVPALPPIIERLRPYHNLPQPDYTRFIGRQQELEWLRRCLTPNDRVWQMVIAGIDGVGKSALALALAHEYHQGYNELPADKRFDVIIWVSAKEEVLTVTGREKAAPAGLIFRTLDDIYTAIAHTLEREDITRAVPEEQDRLVGKALREQRTLLIIDNLEAVADERVKSFLRNLPQPTKAVITSREWLDVADMLKLLGLSPQEAEKMISEEETVRAVRLEATQRQKLVERTAGLPLPIKLSIGRMASGETFEQVLRWLGNLTTGDLPEYCVKGQVDLCQQRDSNAWRLLLACSLFDRGAGATRDALGFVTDLPIADRDDGLTLLQRLSLINRTDVDRFWMLPIVHEYAASELAKLTDIGKIFRDRWVSYFHTFFNTDSYDYTALRIDLPNIEMVLSWLESQERIIEMADLLSISDAIFYADGRWDNYLAFAKRLIKWSQETNTPTVLVGNVMSVMDILVKRGLHNELEVIFAVIAPLLANGVGDLEAEWLLVQTWLSRRKVEWRLPEADLYQAIELHKQAATQFEKTEHYTYLLRVINGLGNIYSRTGNFPEAEAAYKSGLKILEQHYEQLMSISEWEPVFMGNLAIAAGRQGRYEEACEGTYSILPRLIDKPDLAEAHFVLAVYEFHRQNIEKAKALGNYGEQILSELGMVAPPWREYKEWKELKESGKI
jgi:tetratricopeptide (TPR) repeat protein